MSWADAAAVVGGFGAGFLSGTIGIGGGLLFVRWSPAGDAPAGHLETEYFTFGRTIAEAEERVRSLTLHEVKGHLDRLIARARELPQW